MSNKILIQDINFYNLESISLIQGHIEKIEHSLDLNENRFIFKNTIFIIDKVNDKKFQISGYYHDSWIEHDYAYLNFSEINAFINDKNMIKIDLEKVQTIIRKKVYLWQEKYIIAFEFESINQTLFFGLQQNIGGIKMITSSEGIEEFKTKNFFFSESNTWIF